MLATLVLPLCLRFHRKDSAMPKLVCSGLWKAIRVVIRRTLLSFVTFYKSLYLNALSPLGWLFKASFNARRLAQLNMLQQKCLSSIKRYQITGLSGWIHRATSSTRPVMLNYKPIVFYRSRQWFDASGDREVWGLLSWQLLDMIDCSLTFRCGSTRRKGIVAHMYDC